MLMILTPGYSLFLLSRDLKRPVDEVSVSGTEECVWKLTFSCKLLKLELYVVELSSVVVWIHEGTSLIHILAGNGLLFTMDLNS